MDGDKIGRGAKGRGVAPPTTALKRTQAWFRDAPRRLEDLAGRKQSLDDRPFAHPCYWGGFTYAGL